ELFILHVIKGDYFRAAALAFEAVPARGCAYIEHALPGKIFGKRVRAETSPKVRHGNDAGDHSTVQQFQAVIQGAFRERLRLQADQALELRVFRGGIDSQRAMIT